MKRVGYVRQFPGLKDRKNNTLDCPREYELDEDKCSGGCCGCFDKEATIDGKPVPNIFFCPVKPSDTVYVVGWSKIIECTVDEIRFDRDGWYAIIFNDHYGEYEAVATPNSWLDTVFPTREAAWDKLVQLGGDKR